MRGGKYVRLRVVNNWLTVIATLLALYLILAPFAPQLWWWAGHVNSKPNLAIIQVTTQSPPATSRIPSGYWLDIPRLSLHRQIGRELSVANLDKGPWHVPQTSTPDKGSNTVIAGHRFGFGTPYGPFYFLNKLQPNDRVTIDWNGVEYTYKVDGMKEVPPTDLAIQEPSNSAKLTLFTCTPLWSAKDRLVVTANFVAKRTS